MKKVLVITYSQSGQLDEIVRNILKSFDEKVEVHYEKLKPVQDYPWPWPGIEFWDAMPESVRLEPTPLQPLKVDLTQEFDLVILGFSIWFLSPCIPMTSFLKSPEAKRLLNGKPVVTVIGSRNMWVSAQEDIKVLIKEAGGQLKGNIILRDRNQNLISVVTIVYWVSSGKKDNYLGIFPKPGISDEDIKEAERFGGPVVKALKENSFDFLQDELLKLRAVELVPSVVSLERKGKRIFWIWSGIILKKGGPASKKRIPLLIIFKWYLLFVIFAVSPIATLVFYMTYPFLFWQVKKKMKYFSGVELKASKKLN